MAPWRVQKPHWQARSSSSAAGFVASKTARIAPQWQLPSYRWVGTVALTSLVLLPAWRDGAAVVQIDFRDPRSVRDWEGRATTQGALVKTLGVSVAPTVMFFGRGGREVAERLSGTYISDFYGAYLEQRLEQARAAVRS